MFIAALIVASAGCGDDDDGDDGQAGDGGSGSGAAGRASAGRGGSAGASGRGGAGTSGGVGGEPVQCGSTGVLPSACLSCIQDVVSDCGDECAALLNCRADKCAAASDQSAQTACVSMCCLEEATTAVSAPGGQDALRAAQAAERGACAAMCAGEDADAGASDDAGT